MKLRKKKEGKTERKANIYEDREKKKQNKATKNTQEKEART